MISKADGVADVIAPQRTDRAATPRRQRRLLSRFLIR
jgi:hypothetical protein